MMPLYKVGKMSLFYSKVVLKVVLLLLAVVVDRNDIAWQRSS